MKKLLDELETIAPANFDARMFFEARAAKENIPRALKLLQKLNCAESEF